MCCAAHCHSPQLTLEGDHDGTVKGHKYFKCPFGYGVLVDPKKVVLKNKEARAVQQQLLAARQKKEKKERKRLEKEKKEKEAAEKEQEKQRKREESKKKLLAYRASVKGGSRPSKKRNKNDALMEAVAAEQKWRDDLVAGFREDERMVRVLFCKLHCSACCTEHL